MYARVATFESDPASVDDAISVVRAEVESGNTPAGLEGAKMLMLVNRASGKGLGVTLFESEEAMHRGDEKLQLAAHGGVAVPSGSSSSRSTVLGGAGGPILHAAAASRVVAVGASTET